MAIRASSRALCSASESRPAATASASALAAASRSASEALRDRLGPQAGAAGQVDADLAVAGAQRFAQEGQLFRGPVAGLDELQYAQDQADIALCEAIEAKDEPGLPHEAFMAVLDAEDSGQPAG
jgi:hypothetical protein